MVLHWRIVELWSRIKDLRDLETCPDHVQFQLTSVCSQLLKLFCDSESSKFPGSEKVKEVVGVAEVLRIYADEKLLSYPYKDVPSHWRQLYTDAILIKVSAIWARDLIHDRSLSEERFTDWSELIRLLDMVLIIAGAPGRGRREALFLLIESIQQTHLSDLNIPVTNQQDEHRSPKRIRTLTPPSREKGPRLDTKFNPTPLIMNPIPVYEKAPSAKEYVDGLHRGPFVIKRYCSQWACLQTHPWRDIDYLKSVSGPSRVVPVEVGQAYTSEDWGQRIMPWSDVLDSIGFPDYMAHNEGLLYLAQYDLFRQFPPLQEDISIPEYVHCDFSDNSTRIRPASEDGLILNAWLGPSGTVSPAHVDPYYNCYAQIVGRKYVWLASPKFQSEMYPFGSTDEEESLQATYMTNTSQVDVISSCTNDIDSIKVSYPNFVEKVMPEAMQVVLEEGDLMIMPPGWWHSMKSLSPSISVSMWF
ncbi:hypothetical protein CROQUDRAFT_709804 [Cronartium quercuum f. sp. fusiforme G11]|uniref:JmjC domain-containing protein n=1 Tax=Cronartium quercuum f. sp. fusiforme G11 TaxID=708437 RepID=A0A9P6NHQ9_9BASI|nr:hypothetical protein CROQUDRAFT_709804 [Cronartium quercuum f. sp. fusiforme G11]